MEDNLEDRENFNTQGAIINGKLLLEALLVNLENKEDKAQAMEDDQQDEAEDMDMGELDLDEIEKECKK